MRLTVNGAEHEIAEERAGASLLHLLREDLGLTGTKNACEHGECGSCTVRLDDTLVCACLVVGAQARDRRVTTVEDEPELLDAVQTALIAKGGVQCGFCTPGMVMAARDLLGRIPAPTEHDVREALTGNICRCTGYELIIAAVLAAAAPPAQAPA